MAIESGQVCSLAGAGRTKKSIGAVRFLLKQSDHAPLELDGRETLAGVETRLQSFDPRPAIPWCNLCQLTLDVSFDLALTLVNDPDTVLLYRLVASPATALAGVR